MALKLDRSKLVRNLAAKQKLVPYIEREIAKGDFEWNFEYGSKGEDDAWHPSGDCTPSMQDLYLKAKGELDPFGPISGSLYKTFMVGHFWHQYLQWIVEKRMEFCGADDIERRGLHGWGVMGVKQNEVRYFEHLKDPILWKPYHWATGSGDIAPCHVPKHGDYVVDFKTMGAHHFKPKDLPAFFADKYECQINIYMDFFDMDRGLIVGILKDSPHDMKELEYHRNQPLIDAIHQKWQIVSECLDQDIEPPASEEIHLPLKGPA